MSRLLPRILFATLLTPVFIITQVDAQSTASQPPASIGPAKIAFVNLDRVILDCEEGKKMFADIEKFIDSKNSDLDKMKKEADNVRSTLSNPKILKVEAIPEMEAELEMKETALQRFQQDTQKEINSKRDRATNAIGKKVLEIIETIAKQKGLNLVQFMNPAQDAWIDPSLIITEEVVKAYNQKHPGAATKTSEAPAPAKKSP